MGVLAMASGGTGAHLRDHGVDGPANTARQALSESLDGAWREKLRDEGSEARHRSTLQQQPLKSTVGFDAAAQRTGGPRLKGRPGTALPTSAGKSDCATCVPAKQGICGDCRAGSTSAVAPQSSQCDDGWTSSLAPDESAVPDNPASDMPALQMPPNLPVCTSRASMETGASKAARTATNPRNAAIRARRGNVWLEVGITWVTRQL